MNGPGIRPGRMVLLTSGIVDEWLDHADRPLSTASSAGVEPAGVKAGSSPGTLLGSQRSGT